MCVDKFDLSEEEVSHAHEDALRTEMQLNVNKVSCLMCGASVHRSHAYKIAESVEVMDDGTEMAEYYCTPCRWGL